MNTLVITALLLGLGLALVMTLAWRIAETSGNHGYVDTIWSFSTGVACMIGALVPLGTSFLPRQLIVAGLAAIWALRLGSHIFTRTRSGSDDPRYAALRAEWGEDASRRLLIFLQIQALAGFILAIAVMAAAHRPEPALSIADFLGLALALVAIAGAGLADRQLARFRADPGNRGKICDVGLWGLSRHPNYFFEWLGWVAYPVIGLGSALAYPAGLIALAAPLLMYWLLVHASGIPPTEAHMLRSRGAAFRDYQRRVNAFWPGPPRR